jgi:prepilin-type N-terminal cleavage/methylation domain-containing protein
LITCFFIRTKFGIIKTGKLFKEMRNKQQKGFTLIELLVVISIIGLLASVILVGLNSARTKSRDAKRIADIRQMVSAMELFFNSCGNYPSTSPLVTTASNGCAAGTTLANFMPQIPSNPSPGGTAYTYTPTPASCTTSCTGYTLTFTLEGPTGSLSAGLRTASQSGIQ